MRKINRKRKGFTLIEIIAVLIILGILAAVAIPRYVDLQTQAQTAAREGAVSAACSQVHMSFGQHLLANNGARPTGITTNAFTGGTGTAINTDLGDFTAAYTWVAGPPNSVTVGITDANGVATANAGSCELP